MSNNSTAVVLSNLSSNYQYISVGSISITLNCIILYVLLRNKRLLCKSAFVFGLTIGDLCDGVALLGNGAARLSQVLNHLNTIMVHPSYCLQVYGISAVFLLGNQIPGVMFFLIGIERVLAVQYFDWYFLKWSNKIAWICTSCAYGYCVASLVCAFIVVNTMNASTRIPISCATQQTMGVPYITYNYLLCIIGGVLAISTTIWAMVAFTSRKRKLNSTRLYASGMRMHINRQWNTTRIMLLMAVLDVGLVVLPYMLLILKNGLGLDAVQNLGGISLQMGCARSIPNLFIYFCVNVEFRKAIFKAFGIKTNVVNAMHPSTVAKVSTHQPIIVTTPL